MAKILALAVLVLAAARASAQADRKLSGSQSGVYQAQTLVIRTAAEWQSFLGAHADVKPLSDVDFSKDMIVGVFLGERRTAGTSVDIKIVDLPGCANAEGVQADTLLILYSEKDPQGVMSADVVTTPYALAAVPRRAAVQFEREATARALDHAQGLVEALRPDR